MPVNNRKQRFLPKINVCLAFKKKKKLRGLPVSTLASRPEGSSSLHSTLTTSKKLSKLKNQHLFLDLQRSEVTGQTAVPKIGEISKYRESQLSHNSVRTSTGVEKL